MLRRLPLLLLTLCCCTLLYSAESAGNHLLVLQPYWHNGTWVFDDPAKGYQAEPFVLGIDTMISELVADLEQPRAGFRLIFSAAAFPDHQVQLDRAEAQDGGVWYVRQSDGRRGWLCPALFAYFPSAPERIYARAEELPATP